MRHRLFCLMVGILILSPVGCGPKVCDVTGKVTFNGQPLNEEGYKISFLGPNGEQVQAPIAANGEYKAVGVVAGDNKVAVFFTNPTSEGRPRTRGPGARGTNTGLRLPLKYADVNKSNLTVTVDTGKVYTFDMVDEPKEAKEPKEHNDPKEPKEPNDPKQ